MWCAMVRLRRQPYLSIPIRGPTSALRTVKEWMWCKPDSTQLRVFRDHAPAESFEQALRRTTPEDVWICSTNALGGRVQTSLLRHHKANHPRLPAKIRFDPDDSIAHRYKKQGQPVAIPGSGEKVAPTRAQSCKCRCG